MSDVPADRSGIGDPGPLANQEAALMAAQAVNQVAVLGRTTGEDGVQPSPHDSAVLADRVGDDAR